MRFLVPLETESFEVKRRRELLADLKLWDAALDSLTGDIGEERRKSGLVWYQELPTSTKGARMMALQAGLNQLSTWKNKVLAELAPLM